MITPNDIQDKEFSRGVRGYKEDEVDEFLDELTIQLQSMIADNEKLKTDLAEAEAKLDGYKNQESALIKTLEAAKGLMNDISASAEKRADIIIRNAEIDAEAMLRQAKEKLAAITAEEKLINERFSAFRQRYKSMLEAELSQFENLSKETDIMKEAKANQAKAEFDEILEAVEKNSTEKKDFFDDQAFNTLQDEFSKTIVSMRNETGK